MTKKYLRVKTIKDGKCFVCISIEDEKILFGGEHDCGGVDGTDAHAVLQASIDYISEVGGCLMAPHIDFEIK